MILLDDSGASQVRQPISRRGQSLPLGASVSRNGTLQKPPPPAHAKAQTPRMEPSPGPVGKQTVAEAAVAKGSQLDLFMEDNDEKETDT